jgi:beta-phosphoglucomutase-like phosphatase (HAD superfamily)
VTERLVAEIPTELKELVDADRRTNKEVVEAALWREFGGERKGALERRIEEKRRRISMLESERNERDREIDEEKQELAALEQKYEAVESEKDDTWTEAMNALRFTELSSAGVVCDSPTETVERFADALDMDPEAFRAEAIRRYEEGER